MKPTADRRVLRAVLAVLALAMAVRVGYVLATPGYSPSHDDQKYDYLAVGVAHHGAYPDVGARPTAYRPPGYTYVLGAIYAVSGTGHDRIESARLVQAVEGTVLVGLIGLLARRLFDPVTGICAMVIAALYPPLISVGASLLSEPQCAALEVGSILSVLAWGRRARWRWVVLAGVLGGALTLTRTNAFVVLVALGFGIWAAGRRGGMTRLRALVAPGVMLACAVAVVMPWTIRNAVVLHTFIPVSDEAGVTLAGTYNPVSDHDRQAPASWLLLNQIPSYDAQTARLQSGPEPALQSRLTRLAFDYVEAHPLYPAKVAFYNTVRLLNLGGWSRSRFTATLAGVTSSAVAAADVVGLWLAALLALAAASTRRVRRAVPAFVWLAGALMFLSIVFVNVETPRFEVPLDPFLILLAAPTLARLVHRLVPARSRVPRRTSPPSLGMTARTEATA